jgi:AAA family ATP:ADP antiporter
MELKIPFFKKLRTFFWPIYKEEYPKFLPMCLLFFLISFVYNILRAAKDTLIVTAAGAEAIPFIKVWVMLPMAILFTLIFTKLSSRWGREKVFNIMISIFLGFFLLFTFVLYPARDLLQPHQLPLSLENFLPRGLWGFIAIFKHWVFTLFYVMSELWSAIVFSVLFWGFANDVTEVSEAKRFYALFGLGANISGILSGQATIWLSTRLFNPHLPYGNNAWEQSLFYLMLTVIVGGVLILAVFRYLNTKVTLKEGFVPPKEHSKMSLKQHFSYLAKSKYLIYIALIVISYNIAINLVEVLWKNQVKQLYPNPTDYNAYMGEVMTFMGIIATIVSLFVASNLLRKFSWTFNALIPPIVILITGAGFFSFFFLGELSISWLSAFSGITPLALCVLFGSLQNCVSRAAKYTLFDATKEIAFIPLTPESRLKGKAAIDGVGSRIGKSGGSLIYQGLLIITSTLSAGAPYVALLFLAILGVWIGAVRSLGKQFTSLVAQKEKLSIAEEGSAVKVSEKSPELS